MRGKLKVRKPPVSASASHKQYQQSPQKPKIKNSLKVVQHMIKKRKKSLGLPASHKQYQQSKII